tara:strand:+ start:227 stop:1909 length:1683 start_codon:yes stop_codon:yes gene_type:complete
MSHADPSLFDRSNQTLETLLKQGDINQAAQRCEARLQANPKDPAAWFYLAHVGMRQGDLDSALQFLDSCLAIQPSNLAALRTKAEIAFALGRDNLLRATLDLLFKHHKNDPVGRNLLGLLYKKNGEVVFAREIFSLCAKDNPTFVPALSNLARCSQSLGLWEDAMANYDKSLALAPDQPATIAERAGLLDEMGQSDQAYSILKALIARAPTSISVAVSFINMAVRQKKAQEAEAVFERVAQGPLRSPGDAQSVAFAGAQLHDSLGNHDQAFEQLERALAKSPRVYDAQAAEAVANAIIEFFPAPSAQRPHAGDSQLPTPIFVVGMPRSGTSLTEQLLGRSPLVRKGGERRELGVAAYHLGLTNLNGEYLCPPQLSQQQIEEGRALYYKDLPAAQLDRRFLVDKLPGNINNLGVARQLFPEAPLILCRRDPRDVSLSCLMQNFSEGSAFSFSMSAMGHYYGCYHRIEDHWRRYFGAQLYLLDYAALVSSLDSELPRLFAHCGLPFEEQMLSREGSTGRVATASYYQVRQPIYQSSIQRWRHYEKHLGPLIDALEQAGVPLP